MPEKENVKKAREATIDEYKPYLHDYLIISPLPKKKDEVKTVKPS